MPEPSAEDEALIQQMLLSMLTHRQEEPVQDTTELEPASTYNYTDQQNRNAYLERLQQDYAHRAHERSAAERLDDTAYEEVWDKMRYEKMGFPDWAFRPGTPPRWPETWK